MSLIFGKLHYTDNKIKLYKINDVVEEVDNINDSNNVYNANYEIHLIPIIYNEKDFETYQTIVIINKFEHKIISKNTLETIPLILTDLYEINIIENTYHTVNNKILHRMCQYKAWIIFNVNNKNNANFNSNVNFNVDFQLYKNAQFDNFKAKIVKENNIFKQINYSNGYHISPCKIPKNFTFQKFVEIIKNKINDNKINFHIDDPFKLHDDYIIQINKINQINDQINDQINNQINDQVNVQSNNKVKQKTSWKRICGTYLLTTSFGLAILAIAPRLIPRLVNK